LDKLNFPFIDSNSLLTVGTRFQMMHLCPRMENWLRCAGHTKPNWSSYRSRQL